MPNVSACFSSSLPFFCLPSVVTGQPPWERRRYLLGDEGTTPPFVASKRYLLVVGAWPVWRRTTRISDLTWWLLPPPEDLRPACANSRTVEPLPLTARFSDTMSDTTSAPTKEAKKIGSTAACAGSLPQHIWNSHREYFLDPPLSPETESLLALAVLDISTLAFQYLFKELSQPNKEKIITSIQVVGALVNPSVLNDIS